MADNRSAAACSLLRHIFSDDVTDVNLTKATAQANASLHVSPASSVLEQVKGTITSLLIPTFCGFGVVGNVMTILILSNRRMTTAMSCRIKRASRAGLVGLSVADLLCCIAALSVTYWRDDGAAAYSDREQVRLLTAVYGPFVYIVEYHFDELMLDHPAYINLKQFCPMFLGHNILFLLSSSSFFFLWKSCLLTENVFSFWN